jgi:hypothetical protein
VGVVVRETTIETTMAVERVICEFTEDAAHYAAHHENTNEDSDQRDAD